MKLNIDRALDTKMRVPLRFTITMIKEVTIVDDHTLQLRLKYPFAPLAATLSSGILSPISPAAIEKYGEEVRQHPVGAGPYLFQEWIKSDRIVLVRNEDYYGKKPTVEKMIFKIVPEAATREAMLKTGQLDLCYKPLPANVAALKAAPNITVQMPLATRTVFIGMTCQKGVTQSKLVRQAFNYAVDKKAICKKILFDTAVPMEGPMSQKVMGFRKMAKQYDYNPQKAKALLKEAGFDFTKTINMRTCQGRYLFDTQVAEAVQAFLQAIGVKVELRTYDWPTYVAGLLKPLDKTELELELLGWASWTMDADLPLYGQFHSSNNPPNGLGTSFYNNPEYDKAIVATRLEQDPKKRVDLLEKAAKIVWEDCPWIWLHAEKFVIAHRSNIKGLVVTSTEKFWPTYVTME
jgi:peptide/nickel transport system substrate-binding protein